MQKRIHRWLRLSFLVTITIFFLGACGGNIVNNFPSSNTSPVATRLVKHAMGETKVPLHPKRIVALDSCALDHALALGVKPVGAPHYYFTDSPYLKGKVEGIEDIGSPANLEKVLALKPDLILGVPYDNNVIYTLTSQIAPTVLADFDGGKEWREALPLFGEALGKPDAAKQALANYYARIEKFKTQMGDRLKEIEVSLINLYPEGYGLYQEDTFAGLILKDAGLSRPPSQSLPVNGQVIISQERIPEIDADVLFVPNTDKFDMQKLLDKLQKDPLWSRLDVVQQGKVYKVGIYWFSCSSLAANAVIDDLFKYLVNTP
jgi:iron complex transport system substrate-binding protein